MQANTNAVDLLSPPVLMTEVEILELKKIFSEPLVIKYLRSLGAEDNKELISLSVLDMNAELLARRHTMIQGRMSAYVTLLAISQKGE